MSFGASPSDLVMLLNALDHLARTLQKEAVESFERCRRMYQTFSKAARHFDSFVAAPGTQSSDLFRHSRGEIERLLQEFFSKIKDFKPFLGRNRSRRSLRNAIAKIQWSRHLKALEDLRQDLETQMKMIHLAISVPASSRPHVLTQVLPGFPGPESIPRLPIGDHFTFEDAHRVVRLISFRDISNWDHFHEFLLRVFPHRRRGHIAIAARSYVLHNSNTGKDILPSSPCVKAFREVISPDERIEMSVIFPYEDSYTTTCPKCKTGRGDTTNVTVTCHRCGLFIRFQDSFRDEIDPLTQLAMDDIRESSLRPFVDDFFAEAKRYDYFNTNRNEDQLKDLISNNFPDSRIHHPRGSFQENSKIRDFLRVTLYLPQWPCFGQYSSFWSAERLLARVMEGLKRTLGLLQAGPDLPLFIIAKAIGSRAGGRNELSEEFLRLALSMYECRTQQMHDSMQIINVLATYSQCGEESRCQFYPSVVKARCLLWTFSKVLALERELLLNCSKVLKFWYLPQGARFPESSALVKLRSSLSIPSVIIDRLTVDLIVDIVSFFCDTSQPHDAPQAIFQILKDSRKLCLEHCLAGHLENYDPGLTKSRVFDGTLPSGFKLANSSFRLYLESTLRSEGDNLQADMILFLQQKRLVPAIYRAPPT